MGWCILLCLLAVAASAYPYGAADRVVMRSVLELVFDADVMTTRTRTRPVPELQCTGGTAVDLMSLYPKKVLCARPHGDSPWQCTAALPDGLMMDHMVVACEGWSRPRDPYIRRGSCGLKYELHYAGPPMVKSTTVTPACGTIDQVVSVSLCLMILFAGGLLGYAARLSTETRGVETM